jgi:ribosomal protein L19
MFLEVKYESRKGYWALKTFIGICIAKKNAKEKTKIILRNVINNVSVEYNLYIYSSDIVEIKKTR